MANLTFMKKNKIGKKKILRKYPKDQPFVAYKIFLIIFITKFKKKKIKKWGS